MYEILTRHIPVLKKGEYGECVVALLLGADRAERFSEGTLFKLLENGSILRWLIRLKEIDDKE